MGRNDWYRNESWDDQIEAAFRARVARARGQKPQYLKIQAGYLADRHPRAALALIEEYFATGDGLFVPDAHGVQARAFQALGKINSAVEALKKALAWESEHPGLITNARLDYPHLVALERLESEYDNALAILVGRFDPHELSFPYSRYVWNGAHALILQEQGKLVDARYFADRALAAASETQSPFRYHRSLGVVRQTSDEFGRRIKRIAQPSGLRRLFKGLAPASRRSES